MEDQYLDILASDTLPFGFALAAKVADKLESGHALRYGHRDYCGMGMDINEKRQFLYGDLWDGGFTEPAIFQNRDAFIAWLAQQSTASLARLDDEPFFRGNQVITRERLLEFIG